MNTINFDDLEKLEKALAQRAELAKALSDLVNAEALSSVRTVVAGWNGEGRIDGPFQRHPPNLGAQLPKTRCAAIYALDEAMERARALVGKS